MLSVESKPFHWLRYLNAAPHGRGVESARLPFVRAKVDRLPAGCGAVVFASDLQGRVAPTRYGAEERLLGEAVADELCALGDERVIPSGVGAVLAGDLYCVPGASKRGGFGEVHAVYESFASACAWVIGVAGNHDDVSRGVAEPSILLDGDVVSAGGVRFGGVGFVCGNPGKKGRRFESDQLDRIDLVIEEGVDVLVLHEGPSHLAGGEGNDVIRERLVRARVGLTVFGHTGWRQPLAELSDGVQALNVHERVVIATL
ncbi:MAG: hypothetical protein U0269_24980 [Polyangiales bacterium]